MLFPAWSDDLLRASLLTLAATIVGAPILLMVLARTPACTGARTQIVQPVLFDHRHHVRDDGIDCLYCHATATTGAHAGVPATSLCMGCHAQVWRDSPALARVIESAAKKEPIPWVRVYDAPDFVFFDHHAHTLRGVGCVECHGRVDLMPQVVLAKPVLMSTCIACHQDPARHLRPLDKITDMEWSADASTQAALTKELDPRPTTDCVGCHR